MGNESALQRKILQHLQRRGYWGGRHTAAENALKGIPGHLVGEAKEALESLIKAHFILPKPTHYGLQISLNPEQKAEIEAIINEK